MRRLREALSHGAHSPATVTADVELVDRADPTQLLDLWEGAALTIVVDAVQGEGPVGGIVVRDLSDPHARPEGNHRWVTGGTHALGVLEAVELSRVLGTLPPTVIAVGVVAGCGDLGAPLSPQVVAAVDGAAQAVLRILARLGSSGPGPAQRG